MRFDDVTLFDGFWKDLYERNASVSVYAVQRQFERTGRFEGLRFTHAQNPNSPLHFYFDSDVAKWIEAVGYLVKLDRARFADLEAFCDELIASMARNQMPNGYLNSYFQQIEPEAIFKGRNNHELYCMGHLVEAAIAYDYGTGKSTFLQVAERMMDCVYQTFVEEQSASFATCGHAEIELALLRLYEYTGKRRYLDTAAYFLNARGANEKDGELMPHVNAYYHQDDAPARELAEANGHAVRACYYYTALAKYAALNDDAELKAACKRLYTSVTNTKMYITGGVGATRRGEAFAAPYFLPNEGAYSETCAAIGFVFFCYAMLSVERDARYSDEIERVLYNGFLSATSLDGKSFFYENPLAVNVDERNAELSSLPECRTKYPPSQRMEVFECSCCPPNINRLTASLAQYAYTQEEDAVYIEQFLPSAVEKYGLQVKTSFPLEDTLLITGKGYPFRKLGVRIPAWCERYSFSQKAKIEKGYALFEVGEEFELRVRYEQRARFLYANARVYSDVGKVALQYGPIIYCLEGVDNGGRIADLFVDTTAPVKKIACELSPLPSLVAQGARVCSDDDLYSVRKPVAKKTTLTYIPYYAFANRGEQNMQVWVNEWRCPSL